jgi:hypothetical protein
MFNASPLRASVAETLREVGLLVAVFAPLDFLFSQESVPLGVVATITSVGALLVIGGILFGAQQ